jgi:hypothetical protein
MNAALFIYMRPIEVQGREVGYIFYTHSTISNSSARVRFSAPAKQAWFAIWPNIRFGPLPHPKHTPTTAASTASQRPMAPGPMRYKAPRLRQLPSTACCALDVRQYAAASASAAGAMGLVSTTRGLLVVFTRQGWQAGEAPLMPGLKLTLCCCNLCRLHKCMLPSTWSAHASLVCPNAVDRIQQAPGVPADTSRPSMILRVQAEPRNSVQLQLCGAMQEVWPNSVDFALMRSHTPVLLQCRAVWPAWPASEPCSLPQT